MAKLNFICPNCGTEHFKLTECKELIFVCHKCKVSLMITASKKEVIIRMRPPEDKILIN